MSATWHRHIVPTDRDSHLDWSWRNTCPIKGWPLPTTLWRGLFRFPGTAKTPSAHVCRLMFLVQHTLWDTYNWTIHCSSCVESHLFLLASRGVSHEFLDGVPCRCQSLCESPNKVGLFGVEVQHRASHIRNNMTLQLVSLTGTQFLSIKEIDKNCWQINVLPTFTTLKARLSDMEVLVRRQVSNSRITVPMINWSESVMNCKML